MLHDVLRVLCGIITFPIVVSMYVIVVGAFIAISILIAIPGLMLWLAVVMPMMLIYSCFMFAVSNSTHEFKNIWTAFIAMVDPTYAFRDAIVPICMMWIALVCELKTEYIKCKAACIAGKCNSDNSSEKDDEQEIHS